MNGILLDKDDDLLIEVTRDATGKIVGGMTVGERTMQDAYIAIRANRGDVKEDPIIGTMLLPNMRAKYDRENVKRQITVSLRRVGIDFENIKNQLNVKIES